MRDLTFIEDGNENYIREGIVNFTKMRMLAKAFHRLQRYQAKSYHFQELEDIQTFLTKDIYVMRGDKELYKYSRICEPPTRSTSFKGTNDSFPIKSDSQQKEEHSP